jgi:hypothetical protein
MSLGEKATLLITGDYAYGDRGFPGLIPANATLILYVLTLAFPSSSARPLTNFSKQRCPAQGHQRQEDVKCA